MSVRTHVAHLILAGVLWPSLVTGVHAADEVEGGAVAFMLWNSNLPRDKKNTLSAAFPVVIRDGALAYPRILNDRLLRLAVTERSGDSCTAAGQWAKQGYYRHANLWSILHIASGRFEKITFEPALPNTFKSSRGKPGLPVLRREWKLSWSKRTGRAKAEQILSSGDKKQSDKIRYVGYRIADTRPLPPVYSDVVSFSVGYADGKTSWSSHLGEIVIPSQAMLPRHQLKQPVDLPIDGADRTDGSIGVWRIRDRVAIVKWGDTTFSLAHGGSTFIYGEQSHALPKDHRWRVTMGNGQELTIENLGKRVAGPLDGQVYHIDWVDDDRGFTLKDTLWFRRNRMQCGLYNWNTNNAGREFPYKATKTEKGWEVVFDRVVRFSWDDIPSRRDKRDKAARDQKFGGLVPMTLQCRLLIHDGQVEGTARILDTKKEQRLGFYVLGKLMAEDWHGTSR